MNRERLYRVKVKGGGSFLYDTIDVGRFALAMAEVRDPRPFTVKPWRWWARAADSLGELISEIRYRRAGK